MIRFRYAPSGSHFGPYVADLGCDGCDAVTGPTSLGDHRVTLNGSFPLYVDVLKGV